MASFRRVSLAGAARLPPASRDIGGSCWVETGDGLVRGFNDINYNNSEEGGRVMIDGDDSVSSCRFLGVPFAAPPLGDLRWRSPQPPVPWAGRVGDYLDARFALANSCVQDDNPFTMLTDISEDCLYLNVFAPSTTPSEELKAVMLFFYGGSWEEGSATCPLYWAKRLATEGDVLVVTANYRLSVFGFLGSSELQGEEEGDGSTGNFGLQDQRAAMQWIQRNIAKFGGDPDRVTIFGESAGSGSVAVHLTAPRSYAPPALFHGAIMESGPVAAPWNAQTLTLAQRRFDSVADLLGCGGGGGGGDLLSCMRNATAEDLFAAGRKQEGKFLTWSPVIDGVELVDLPMNLAAAGLMSDVPILLGTNADEGSMFVDIDYDEVEEAAYEAYARQIWGDDLAAAVLPQYPLQSFNGTEKGKVAGHGAFWATAASFGDALMSCPARRTARHFANRSGDAGDAFLYFFRHELNLLPVADRFGYDADEMGVFHGSELVFVFDFEPVLAGDKEVRLADTFVEYWSNFAKFGDPNGEQQQQRTWDAFSPASDECIVLDLDCSMQAGLKRDLCDFWDTITIPESVVFGDGQSSIVRH